MYRQLADATWPELEGCELVLVPVGSIEQHGPHLPLDTDTVIAEAVVARVAERLPSAWVARALTYGASGEHQGFAGTSSIGTDVLRLVVVELVRSLRRWARRVVFVNAHGGNLRALAGAVEQLAREGHDVAWVPCATEEFDLHAGFTETSLMLHLSPESVRLDRAEAGCTAPLAQIMPALLAGGVAAVSSNGVLGDPAGATAEEGRRVLEVIVDDVCRRLANVGVS
jgi:mycofactocin system creatininase family protein